MANGWLHGPSGKSHLHYELTVAWTNHALVQPLGPAVPYERAFGVAERQYCALDVIQLEFDAAIRLHNCLPENFSSASCNATAD